MSFYISHNNISITRGDTASVALELERDNKPYVLATDDSGVLTVKRAIDNEDYVFQKPLVENEGVLQFIIEPDDTKNLEYGEYVYDVQITLADGGIYTVVSPHKFWVKDEVTTNV